MIFKSFNIYKILSLISILAYPYGPTSTEETDDGFKVDYDYHNTPSGVIQTRDGKKEIIESINSFLSKYSELAFGIFGLLTITLVVVAMVNFASLGSSANNPNARRMAITKILLTCIASALMGSLTLVIAIVYNIFRWFKFNGFKVKPTWLVAKQITLRRK